jgi:DHA1 family inner membrane transport protein
VAAVFSGLTVANIGGVPLATWVGQHFGWRIAFTGIGGLGLIALAALAFALPKMPGEHGVKLGPELAVMRRPAVLIALLITALGSSAMFTVFTYIAPILRAAAHASPDAITIALVIYGVGLTIGNAIGGRFADRALKTTLLVVLAALTGLLALFALTMHHLVPALATVFAWGVATFALVPPLQAKVMALAKGAPTLASAVNIGAFNLGNAAGAALGGAVIAAGVGYPAVSLAGAAMAALALALVLITGRSGDRSRKK